MTNNPTLTRTELRRRELAAQITEEPAWPASLFPPRRIEVSQEQKQRLAKAITNDAHLRPLPPDMKLSLPPEAYCGEKL